MLLTENEPNNAEDTTQAEIFRCQNRPLTRECFILDAQCKVIKRDFLLLCEVSEQTERFSQQTNIAKGATRAEIVC